MTDPQPNPRVSNKISPLAVIVVIILIGIVVVALVKREAHHHTPTGVAVPMSGVSNATMPQQSDVPNQAVPRARTNDSMEAAPTGNEEGMTGAGGVGNSQ